MALHPTIECKCVEGREGFMNDAKKIKYLTKKVRFNGKDMTLYSIDGATWSSRRDELTQIIERHESEKLTFGEIRGQLSANKPIAPKKSPEKFNKFRQAALQEKQRAVELVEAEAKKQQAVPGKAQPKAKEVKVKEAAKAKPSLPAKNSKEKKPAKAEAIKETPKKRATSKPVKKGVAPKSKGKKKAA